MLVREKLGWGRLSWSGSVAFFVVISMCTSSMVTAAETSLLSGVLDQLDEGDDHHGAAPRPDTHAPAGLMGDHAHKAGEVMAEYKFMTMSMDDNRTGTDKVSDAAALMATGSMGSMFMVAGTRMHMLHLMPMWTSVTMDHRRMNGTRFRTHNEGFDDMAAGALWLLETSEVR